MTRLTNTTPNGWSAQQIVFDTMTSEESANVVERMEDSSCCVIPSRPKARRRSSCSALPSNNNASWEPIDEDYGNFVVSLESLSKSNTMPLGTFFRSNSNAFSVSSQSDSDTSICGLSGHKYASDSNEKPTTEKKKSRKKKLSKDIPDTFSFPSKNEISIHRKMTRRSSWSGAVSATYPNDDGILEKDKLLYPTEIVSSIEVDTPTDGSLNLERNISEQLSEAIYGVYHDDSMAPQQSTTSTRRRMNRRSSWHAATHFSTEQKDGVITSFKLSHSKTVMYEETLVDVENSECLPNYNSVQLEENLSIQRHVPIDSIHSAPELLSDSMFPEKEFKRSLLMAKHIQTGATRGQRRASWSGSTTNYLDYAEQTNNSGDQVQRSTRELFVDIISTCKKQAKYVPHDEDEQPYSLPTEDPTKRGYYFSKETDQSVETENTTIETSTNRAERRASWHSSCSQEHLISTSTLNTQYSQQSQHSQKFVMDLSQPQKNWITKDWIEGDENEEMEEDGVGSDHKSTTSGTSNTYKSRSWILGKGNKDRSSRRMIPKTTSNLVVVSNANMPHPGQPCLEPFEDTPEVGFIQLTAFGDVTVIGHDE
jgi:hypothetical protein